MYYVNTILRFKHIIIKYILKYNFKNNYKLKTFSIVKLQTKCNIFLFGLK